MAVKFFNIRSGETQTCETEPMIAAFWASSDHSPNIAQGQDFGWRLAPEVVVELNRIASDPDELQKVANRFRITPEDVTEYQIITFISRKTVEADAPVAKEGDYTDTYAKNIRKAEEKAQAKVEKPDTDAVK